MGRQDMKEPIKLLTPCATSSYAETRYHPLNLLTMRVHLIWWHFVAMLGPKQVAQTLHQQIVQSV